MEDKWKEASARSKEWQQRVLFEDEVAQEASCYADVVDGCSLEHGRLVFMDEGRKMLLDELEKLDWRAVGKSCYGTLWFTSVGCECWYRYGKEAIPPKEMTDWLWKLLGE